VGTTAARSGSSSAVDGAPGAKQSPSALSIWPAPVRARPSCATAFWPKPMAAPGCKRPSNLGLDHRVLLPAHGHGCTAYCQHVRPSDGPTAGPPRSSRRRPIFRPRGRHSRQRTRALRIQLDSPGSEGHVRVGWRPFSAQECSKCQHPSRARRVTYPPCPKCRMPTRLALVEPLEEPGHESRIYECPTCKESATVVVRQPMNLSATS
jgi:hypothetical protein